MIKAIETKGIPMIANEHISKTRRKRTHCIRGHEYTPENTSTKTGYRVCITCRTALTKIRNAKEWAKGKESREKSREESTAAELAILAELESRKTYGVKIAAEVQQMTPAEPSRT